MLHFITIQYVLLHYREDLLETSFLVPRSATLPSPANILEEYLEQIRALGYRYSIHTLHYYNSIHSIQFRTSRVWFTGRHDCFVKSPMGRNYLTNIPHKIAGRLDLDEVKDYTFHSFRRSAATTCADQGATALQMQSHFGWKNPTMAQVLL